MSSAGQIQSPTRLGMDSLCALRLNIHGLLQRLIGGQWSGCRSAALAKDRSADGHRKQEGNFRDIPALYVLLALKRGV